MSYALILLMNRNFREDFYYFQDQLEPIDSWIFVLQWRHQSDKSLS